jgi:hypothetical protein
MTIGASWWTWPSRVSSPWPETTTASTSTSSLRWAGCDHPGRAGSGWPAGPPRRAATAPLDGSRPRPGWPGRPEAWGQACHQLPIHRPSSPEHETGRGSPAGYRPRSRRRPARRVFPNTARAGTDQAGGTAAAGHGTAVLRVPLVSPIPGCGGCRRWSPRIVSVGQDLANARRPLRFTRFSGIHCGLRRRCRGPSSRPREGPVPGRRPGRPAPPGAPAPGPHR